MSASMLDFESLELDFDPANLPRGEDLPYSDGEPLDSYWHREAMNVLIHSLEYHWRGRTDYFAGGDMFIHFSPTFLMNRDFRGPDVFVVLGTTLEPPRKSWVVWEEGWKYPNVVVELMSESTTSGRKRPSTSERGRPASTSATTRRATESRPGG